MHVSYSVLAAAEETHSPVLPQPAEIIVGLIAFLILFYLLKTRAVPKFEAAYKARTDAIEGGIARAEKAQHDAEAALRQYTAQLSDAKGEAQKLRDEARAEGAAIIEQMRTAAQEEANRITASARAAIESERQQALNSLTQEVGTIATNLASKIVGEALDDQVRQSRVVERFLIDLEAGKK